MPQELHLAMEETLSPVEGGPAPRRGERESSPGVRKLVAPFGAVRYLGVGSEGAPFLAASADASSAPVALEALYAGPRPGLAMLSRAVPAPRVNGAPAPRATVLWERDTLELSGCPYVLHVCVFSIPEIGPSLPEEVGDLCPYCKTEILEDSRVYRCHCGKAMHFDEDTDEDSEEGLQCARLAGRCIACNRPLMLVRGYGSLPDFLARNAPLPGRRPSRSRRRDRVVTE